MLYACAKLSQGGRVLFFIFENKIFVIGKPLTKITKIFLLEIFSYTVVIARAKDIMADNSPSPRAQPENECYIVATSVEQKVLT